MLTPTAYTFTLRVAAEDIDAQNHVNNVAYLKYVQDAAVRHWFSVAPADVAAAVAWVVRRHEIEYARPARLGDELELTVRVELVRGVRGVRRTTISLAADGAGVANVWSEWVWVRLADGRPSRVPSELVEVAARVTADTLARRSRDGVRA